MQNSTYHATLPSLPDAPEAITHPGLTPEFGLLRATALNMSNVVGIGPFITIPLMLSAMGGPQVLLGWVLGALVALCDGQVWSELGAAWPGSGGSYRFLREAYGPQSAGRLMAFLFIWTFVLSGPLEIASGMIGFAQYATFLVPALTDTGQKLVAASVGVIAVVLLYRRIQFIGALTVTLWAGTVATMVGIIVLGAPHFDPHLAFTFPPGAFSFTRGFFQGLGSAMLIAMYDYMGYYDVCYIGDEVRDPVRTIPRSILYCVVLIAIGYLSIETIVIGVMPWQVAQQSQFVISELMLRLYGRPVAILFTVMILWTAFAACFAVMLGYSRVPYAAAREGYFFQVFAKVHPTKHIPHVSVLVLGGVTIACAFLRLEDVIAATMTTRILVQFVAQIFALPLLRKRLRDSERPYRMWLYPLPALVALVGWLYIFATSGLKPIAWGLATVVVGMMVYFWRAKSTKTWPFYQPLNNGC